MGSKNLRSSGSSASGLKGGLKAWLHRITGTDSGTDECAESKARIFSKKNKNSVSRSSDFNWEITRYDKQPGYENVREEFEKRRNVEVKVPAEEIQANTEPVKVQMPVRDSARPTVPTLDVYFKEESIKVETKTAERPVERTEVRSYRQESLFDREPKMVETEEDNKFITGVSYFSGVSAAVEMPTCSSVSETPVQMNILDTFNAEPEERPDIYTEIGSNEECSTVIEISSEDSYIESLCDDIATFTVMNDILPEIMAEEEFTAEEVIEEVKEADPEDKYIEDLCEELVAEFIINELMPGLLGPRDEQKYVPEYVITDIGTEDASETVIEIPETVPEITADEGQTAEVTSFLFGFGNPVAQSKGATGFRFVFGGNDDADYDDEEVASVSVNDAAITASSLSGGPVGL